MIIEIILGIVVVILGYTTYNQMQKVERLENWVEDFADRIELTKNTLDELDSEGKFEADDEIGTIFEGIKDTINELNEITDKDI
tara:strand:- start:1079 stop:1330 length:252 start_codon:yes stop_codon:yes gene_type:complete